MHKYTFGIEEEYFVVDRRTGGLKVEPPRGFMKAAGKRLGARLTPEILQSQVEIATVPMETAAEARAGLREFRSALAEVGRDFGLGILAAGTHPSGRPERQLVTRKRRYLEVIRDLGSIGVQTPLCGLHVHVEVPEPDQRAELMHRMMPFLPMVLALSTSSPFWAGTLTDLLGYRNAANAVSPRSGFPDMFADAADYERYVEVMVSTGVIRDASYIWWALRPASKYPTLELRIADCCTSVDDAVAIAGLFRALVRHLVDHPEVNSQRSVVARALAKENGWRAQRYGTDGTFIDADSATLKPFGTLFEALLERLGDDIAALQLEPDVERLRAIVKSGTSAHRQLALYASARDSGRSHAAALREICQWLRLSTEAGDYVDAAAPR